MKRKILAIAAASAAAAVPLLSGGVASAAGTNVFPDYGFDGNAHLIVEGGSTTVYKAVQSLATLWDSSQSCAVNFASNHPTSGSPATYPQAAGSEAYNQCAPASQTYGSFAQGGNYDADTVAVAAPAGSSNGIGSLNGDRGNTVGTFAYEGTNQNIATTDTGGFSNGYGTVDFAGSSRAASTSNGSCPTTGTGGAHDELACDTFWGFASDGVEVFTWGSRDLSSGALTASDLYNIYNGTYTRWSQVADLNIAPNSASDGPIVPWSMNSASGTFADFNNYLIAKGGAPSGFTVNTSVARKLNLGGGNTAFPLENDVKPLLDNAQTQPDNRVSGSTAGLNFSDPNSTQNPSNWLWFGSYGLLNAFPYLANYAAQGTTTVVNTTPAEVDGVAPSNAVIGAGTYPIERILNLVTAKADADCPVVSGACNLTGGPVLDDQTSGATDIKVNGATSGKGGAVREFIRFVCRSSNTQQATDPYSGVNLGLERGSAISGSGFNSVPRTLRSAGSACDVQSVG